MPARRGEDSQGPYYQWGNKGRKYHYQRGNEGARKQAKARAHRQGRAIFARRRRKR